jgi:acetyltransferase-like isoleucine patch superfamily enzyme
MSVNGGASGEREGVDKGTSVTRPSTTPPTLTPPSMTPQQRELTEKRGLSAYREFAFGSGGLPAWLWFETYQLLATLPGVLGYGTRMMALPTILRRCGTKPAVGRGLMLRRPSQVTFGNRVVIDELVSLEVRGDRGSIMLSDRVSIGRLSTVVAKQCNIEFGPGCNIGSYCRIASESGIVFGESVLVAAYAYIGAGNHQHGSDGKPLIEQRMDLRGGVRIGDHAWIGAGAMVMDGVQIGARAIIGAQSLVTEDVPADAVVVGTPARVVKRRE